MSSGGESTIESGEPTSAGGEYTSVGGESTIESGESSTTPILWWPSALILVMAFGWKKLLMLFTAGRLSNSRACF